MGPEGERRVQLQHPLRGWRRVLLSLAPAEHGRAGRQKVRACRAETRLENGFRLNVFCIFFPLRLFSL